MAEADASSGPTASAIIDALASGPDERVTLGAIAAAAGSRVHGLALLFFVLPEVPPLPLPSASTVLAIPLIGISVHLSIFGETAKLPRRVEEATLPRSALAAASRYLSPVFRWVERISRPRLGWLARRERLVGLVCLALSIILILPLPLFNAPPAICLAVTAFGLIQRDGLFIAAGIVGTILLMGMLAGVIDVASTLLVR
ncbi:MAG: exopolysaccharide biosynthesis protein [Bauldia sp.]|nr:exopolysaccharide biosynthesis protein [Bauldia sp.]